MVRIFSNRSCLYIFLIRFIVSAVYVGYQIDGSFYAAELNSDFQASITRSDASNGFLLTQYALSSSGALRANLSNILFQTPFSVFDPRLRPWYQSSSVTSGVSAQSCSLYAGSFSQTTNCLSWSKWSAIYPFAHSGVGLGLSLSLPIFSNSSSIVGFIGVDLRISDLNSLLASSFVDFSPDSVQLILQQPSPAYLVIASSDPSAAPDPSSDALYQDACSSSNEQVASWCTFDQSFLSVASSAQLLPASTLGFDWFPRVPQYHPAVRVRNLSIHINAFDPQQAGSLDVRLAVITDLNSFSNLFEVERTNSILISLATGTLLLFITFQTLYFTNLLNKRIEKGKTNVSIEVDRVTDRFFFSLLLLFCLLLSLYFYLFHQNGLYEFYTFSFQCFYLSFLPLYSSIILTSVLN